MALDRQTIGGLSPLARGTRHCLSVQFSFWRFIPAGAGNTSVTLSGGEDEPVYPRWRGEHFKLDNPNPGVSGLSPLARGTLLR